MSTITVSRTITEHVNGRIKDDSYATGYKRRAGVEPIDPTKPRKGRNTRVVYVEAPAPVVQPYKPHSERGEGGLTGGTVHTHIEVDGPFEVVLDEVEVKALVQSLLRDYSHAYDIAAGVIVSGGKPLTGPEAIEEMDRCRKSLAKFGYDVSQYPV